MRDYVQIALDYARWAADEKNAGEVGLFLRLGARRSLTMFEEATSDAGRFDWSDWHANDICDFVEKLPHVEGVWDTPEIQLEPFQVWFLVMLFGFRHSKTGTRLVTTAVLLIGRKNAKSTLVAPIALYCLCCEGEVGPQVVTAATTGAQAGIVFNIAKRMVEQMPDLADAFHLTPRAKAVACFSNGGTFKAVNAKASTQDGLNPSCIVFDEVHAQKDRGLFDVLRSAAGARRSPLFLCPTTEGYENAGPWGDLRKMAHDVLRGVVEADHLFAAIFAIDDEDDELDPACWPKANPLMRVNPMLRAAIEKEAADAKTMPSAMAEFRIKRCNRPSSTAQGWTNLSRWNACRDQPDVASAARHESIVYLALDLSESTDLCALRAIWRTPDGYANTIARRWIPASALKQRTNRGAMFFAGWVEKGLIEVCEGDVIDHRVVEAAVMEFCARFRVAKLGVDPWNATELTVRLIERGVQVEKFRQQFSSYHPAMSDLERVYLSGKLRHGGDPVLRWNAANLVPRFDEQRNVMPSKKRSADKIDDMCALIMANGMMLASQGEANWDDTITQPLKVRL